MYYIIASLSSCHWSIKNYSQSLALKKMAFLNSTLEYCIYYSLESSFPFLKPKSLKIC